MMNGRMCTFVQGTDGQAANAIAICMPKTMGKTCKFRASLSVQYLLSDASNKQPIDAVTHLFSIKYRHHFSPRTLIPSTTNKSHKHVKLCLPPIAQQMSLAKCTFHPIRSDPRMLCKFVTVSLVRLQKVQNVMGTFVCIVDFSLYTNQKKKKKTHFNQIPN